jgi:GH25 family lysozyme M1 (1,4-beta-N-acetylmuramidase)
MGPWRRRVFLIAFVAGAVTAGLASGAVVQRPPDGRTEVSGPMTHPERDYAGSGLAMRHFGLVQIAAPAGLPGLDVSSWQGNVDWAAVAANGARFAYVKATESTTYVNPYFTQQYVGAYQVGLVRGAYHFALPDRSAGAAQADWFADHGGAWSADNQTLPGALDIEYNPYGPTCYGLNQAAMVSWLTSFINQYRARTGRWAVIYTSTSWWQQCTGNYAGFGASNPLWIASWSSNVGPLPAGWSTYAFWQWSNQPVQFPGDQDVFNGSQDGLVTLANNAPPPLPPPPPPPPLPPPPLPPPPRPPPPPVIQCRVPRVIGLRLATARARIRRANCSLGRVRRARSRRVGRVLAQAPRAGMRRARGARMILVVGRRR